MAGKFESWATRDPKGLIKHLYISNDIHDLTYGLEALHRVKAYREEAYDLLLIKIQHNNAVVREGAIYGLTGFKTEEVIAILYIMSKYDMNLSIRKIASEYLNDCLIASKWY